MSDLDGSLVAERFGEFEHSTRITTRFDAPGEQLRIGRGAGDIGNQLGDGPSG